MRSNARKSSRRNVRLELERLEDRWSPAVIPVSNVAQLQSALNNAGNFDTIQMAGGGYFTQGNPILFDNQAKFVTIAAAPGATVQMDGGNIGDIFRIRNPAGNPGTGLQFQNIVFQSGVTGTPGVGGAVTIQNANVTFTACLFQNNAANIFTGGGAMNVTGNANVQLNGCILQNNSATDSGGGIELQGGAHLTVQTSHFLNNFTNGPGHSAGSQGGAIHVGNSFATIYNSVFESNHAGAFGGAIATQGVFGVGSASITCSNCSFSNNGALRDGSTGPSPTEGGAVSVEDNTVGTFNICRFDNNQAETGGAITVFRAQLGVDQSTFTHNLATATGSPSVGFGGAILGLSQDIENDGNNRPNARITVTNSYITGDPNGGTVAQEGAGIFIAGDTNRLFGQGVPQSGGVPENQATLVLGNVIFNNCNVQENGGVGGSGNGGALFGNLANITANNVLVENCSARPGANPSNAAGGGFLVLQLSNLAINSSTFVNNSAGSFGGAIEVKASNIGISNTNFLNNSAGAGFGSAIAEFNEIPTANPNIPWIVPGFAAGSVNGTVQNSLFSGNTSADPIFEVEQQSSANLFNNVVYNGNSFFVDPGVSPQGFVYLNQQSPPDQTATGLNTFHTAHAAKSTTGGNKNVTGAGTNGAPIVLQLFGAPQRQYTFTTPFENATVTPTALAFVVSGTPAAVLGTPNGPTPVSGPAGVMTNVGPGTYTLNATGGTQATASIIRPTLLVTGADAGGGPYIHIFDAQTGELAFTILAYDPFLGSGVRVAQGDFNGDGVVDFATVAGPGGGPQVKVFTGAGGQVIDQFFVENPAFTGGLYIAAGDVNNDGVDDIITGADAGGGPSVKSQTVKTGTSVLIYGFFAYDPSFTGGVRVGAGDVQGNGFADIITAAGPGGGSDVGVWDSKQSLNVGNAIRLFNFFAFEANFATGQIFTGGSYVAGGDVNGDGKADIIAGAGPGGGPNVVVYSGADQAHTQLASFFPLPQGFTGGVRVGSGDANQDGRDDVISGAGPGGGPNVAVFSLDGNSLPLTPDGIASFFAYDQSLTSGIFVASSRKH